MDNNSESNRSKIYYTISETADMFSVSPTLIRYWANYFPQIKPHKNKKGNRLFTPADIETFKRIYHLTKECGMKLEAVSQKLDTPDDEFERREEIRQKLQTLKSIFEAVNIELDNIDRKKRETVVWSSADEEYLPMEPAYGSEPEAPYDQDKGVPLFIFKSEE